MLKIGDFSRLSQIGIHALRNYDKIGLLQPEQIDKFTGYRYYTLQQLPRAHRIIALKEMGLSLEQIGNMLNQEMSVEELRGMFRLKQAEVEQKLRDEQKRLAMIEFHLNMIELEDKMPELNVVMKELLPFKALYIRVYPNPNERQAVAGKNHLVNIVQQEITKTLAEQDIKPIAPQVDTFHGEEFNADDVSYSFAIPVDDSVSDNIDLPTKGTLLLCDMPAVHAATMVVKGVSPEKGIEKKALLQRWAVENGYTLKGEMRIVFYDSIMDGTPPSERVVEMQVIVEPQAQEA